MNITNETLMNGAALTLASGTKATVAPDHGGIHVTLVGARGVSDVVCTNAEARAIGAYMTALADHLDAKAGS